MIYVNDLEFTEFFSLKGKTMKNYKCYLYLLDSLLMVCTYILIVNEKGLRASEHWSLRPWDFGSLGSWDLRKYSESHSKSNSENHYKSHSKRDSKSQQGRGWW